MFGRKVKEAEPEAEVPVGAKAVKPDIDLLEYKQLADKLGFNNQSLLEAQMLNFFYEEGITVWPKGKVEQYLAAMARKENVWRVFVWRPLRECDNHRLQGRRDGQHGTYSERIYQGAVPLPVLMTVDKIVQKFGDQVVFFVSDYETPSPDPFLLVVSHLGGHGFVIERWDEPSFRL